MAKPSNFPIPNPSDPLNQQKVGLQIKATLEGALDILQDGVLITRYHFGNVPARPYFYPLYAPGNICLTRGYPMNPVEGETKDHPHHRSLWIAHGDVNGVDNWSEEIGHGSTIHQRIESVTEEHDHAGFRTTSLWTSAASEPLLTQSLEVKAWRGSDLYRLLDFNIELTATEGDVRFGDTKEGGILSTRVASALDVPRGGKITNSSGGMDEKECWGKHADWCAYSGRIDNKECGIAIFNHPDSFRAPTTWHVRNYGLMTANPFGYAAFTEGAENGEYLLPKGERLPFYYRAVLYQGVLAPRQIAALYLNYISTPR